MKQERTFEGISLDQPGNSSRQVKCSHPRAEGFVRDVFPLGRHPQDEEHRFLVKVAMQDWVLFQRLSCACAHGSNFISVARFDAEAMVLYESWIGEMLFSCGWILEWHGPSSLAQKEMVVKVTIERWICRRRGV